MTERAANFVTMHLPANDARNACCGMGAPSGPDGTTNVNIVVPIAEARNMANRKEAYFDETLARVFPTAWEKVRNMRRVGGLRSVGCFAHNTRRAAYPGALLAGDAATFIHPFTGEGVFFALRGAQLAAAAIDAALGRNGSADDLRAYDAARRRELLPRYLLCDAVTQIVHSPSLLAWAAERMRRAPALADALLEAAGDRIQPLDLLTPQNLRLFLTTL